MKEIRPPQASDQENTEKAYELIINLINENEEIERTLWVGAIWSVLVNGYHQCDFSYKDFCEEVKMVSKHYKSWWEEE
jgi:uncharacterized protein (DUF4213/DUF364 family)